jgi:hypothetical protein
LLHHSALVVVAGLRGAGVDVWYDEHNLGAGRLGPTIERELRRRPVFIVVLSPAALRWAYALLRNDANRILQPVTASALNDADLWLFVQDFKRIEASGCQPLPVEQAIRRLLRALGLTPADEASSPPDALASASAAEAEACHAPCAGVGRLRGSAPLPG